MVSVGELIFSLILLFILDDIYIRELLMPLRYVPSRQSENRTEQSTGILFN